MLLHPGDMVNDRFEVEAMLGEGGMAQVYRVRHSRLHSCYALKILTHQRGNLAERFLLEGQIAAQLRHPNIVSVTDLLEHRGLLCLLMEFVDGLPLDQIVRDISLSLDEVLEIFAGILAGVTAAHDAGVLHRDLKPSNVLVQRGTSGWVPKVADFGIAKLAEGTKDGRITLVGAFLGTPGYMAPEQASEASTIDSRADIFALGVLLYEMISGQSCFIRPDTFATLNATAACDYIPVQQICPDCPDYVREAIEHCLMPDPADRPANCRELAKLVFVDRPDLFEYVNVRRKNTVSLDSFPSSPPRVVRSHPTVVPDFGGIQTPTPGLYDFNTNRTVTPFDYDTHYQDEFNPFQSDEQRGPEHSVSSSIVSEPSTQNSSVPNPTHYPVEYTESAYPRRRVWMIPALLVFFGLLGGLWYLWTHPRQGAVEVGDGAPATARVTPDAPLPAAPPEGVGPETEPDAEPEGDELEGAEFASGGVAAPEAEEPPAAAAESPAPVKVDVAVAGGAAADEGGAEDPAPEAVESEAVEATDGGPDDASGAEDVAAAGGEGAPGDVEVTALQTDAADAADGLTALETETADVPPAPPPTHQLAGEWSGKAGGRPMRLALQQTGESLSGEVSFMIGNKWKTSLLSGQVDGDTLYLFESGGSELQMSASIADSSLRGTYTATGYRKAVSWSVDK